MKIKDTGITRVPFIPPKIQVKRNTFFAQKADAAMREKAERNREMTKVYNYFMQVTADGTKIPRSMIDIRKFSPRYKGEKGQERLLKFEWKRFHEAYKEVHGKYFEGTGQHTTLISS